MNVEEKNVWKTKILVWVNGPPARQTEFMYTHMEKRLDYKVFSLGNEVCKSLKNPKKTFGKQRKRMENEEFSLGKT